ncbi:hypothetical protein KPH14_010287 [Odynerus spinipes]|uniref:Uncharacterized protein n=1 Tax=Odynerus spinipes TaxID=1348599 RepID=A0AAD9RTQ0_9HYME|nr:hypothetical protein KPH14_010287 [Odynerus spinipes]
MMVSSSLTKRGHIRWDAVASASSVPNTHTSSPPFRISLITMGFAKIHVVSCILLILGLVIASECAKKNLDEDTRDNLDDEKNSDDLSFTKNNLRATTEAYDRSDDKPPPDEEFPILPPIILLDFNNDTIDGNSTGEEKSKRTVNGGLGYGFERNSFASKKTNYYFPTGKTGTTVSIEESISPFLPRTIIEKYTANNQSPSQQARVGTQNDAATYRFASAQFSPESQSVFGHRTKLHKATGYYDALDLNYRGSNQPVHHPSISSSTPSSVQGQHENYLDSKSSSRYTFTNLNSPTSYQSTNFNTDLHGQRGNIFRSSGQTYIERGQNVFRPTIATPQTDNSQIFRENLNVLRSSTPGYYGLKQTSFNTVPTDPLNSSSRSHSGNQAAIYTEVHPQSYNEQRQSQTVLTTPRSLDPNSPSYRYLQNIFNPRANQQVYEGQRQNLGIGSQDSAISDIQNFDRDQNYYRNYVDQRQGDQTGTTPNSLDTNYELIRNPTTLSNLPRYTIENGVRYENKVFWKYPDGRISYDPPQTYVESYPEDSTVRPQVTNFQETYQETSPSTENSVNAQGPVQFPNVPDAPAQQSQFVSSESLTSNLSHQQAYRIGYQNLLGKRPAAALAQRAKIDSTASTASTFFSTTPFPTTKKSPLSNTKRNRQRNYFSSARTTTERPVSRYMVGGPNPEYIDTTEPSEPLKTESADGGARNKAKQYSKNANSYENLQYSDLINYNPSISQYIKDPSSILNVQPTFVQVGNSLVPVIILKVDGTAPAQPEATSNINLKALLQEYLVQYADSIKELAQPTNYDLGTEQFTQTQRTIETGNRLLHLIIVLFLYWSYARGTETTESLQDEIVFDQIATASENIVKIAKTVPPPPSGTSIHYENSNGFLPMTPPSPTQRYEQQLEFVSSTTYEPENVQMDQENSTVSAKLTRDFTGNMLKGSDKLENDLVYSPEARIFLDLPHSGTNRRSFEFRDDQNMFELLKVHNDTPAIANYNDFYENIEDDLSGSEDNDEVEENSSGNESKRGRGKRIGGSYATSYGTATDQNAETDDTYGLYYSSYGAVKDEKKRTSHKPEKVTSNYHQRSTVNYNGHGQSASRHKTTPETSTSSRTSYEGNDLNRKTGSNYDNAASSSKARHKFTKPVVVAEPKDYQIDLKFDGQSSKSFTSPPAASQNNFKLADSAVADSTNVYNGYHQEARGRSYDRTEDSSDDSNDSMDYMDYNEKPRRVQKNKRRPYGVDSRRLPKEHRTMMEDSMESDNYRKRPSSTRSRPHRQRTQTATIWIEDDRNRSEDESTEERPHESRVYSSTSETKHTKSQQHFKPRPSNTWSQLGPNVEISHSSGIEIDPSEKSNLVIPVGLMSIANFDHATALGNSQGFDVSNVVYQNLVTPTPGGPVSTAATPLLGSHQSTIGQNVPRTLSNIHNVGLSTPIPDIIVGQNSFQNPMHTVLVPQHNLPNKIQQNSNTQYVSSTISPVFALTTRLTPTLQNLRVQSIPNNVTPRPAFATTSPSSNLQQITVNQVQPGISHFIVPQPTVQTLSNLIQAPTQASSEYNIQVNPHGLQGQNVISQNNLQMAHYPVQTATTQSPPFQPVTRVNLITAETENKKTLFPATGGSILASASFTVGQNHQVQNSNDNNYASQNILRPQLQDNSYRLTKDDNSASKTKTYLQNANLVPFYHPVPPVDGVNLNQQTNLYHSTLPTSQNPQNINVLFPRFTEQNSQYQNALHQLQLQLQQQQNQVVRNNKFTNYPYQMSDTVGSQSISNINVAQDNNFAHFPKLGAKNVEILNPNIKPSPIDTTIINPLQTIHYPILTTPIPIFSTTPIAFGTSTQGPNLQSYVHSFSEIGTKSNQQSSSTVDTKAVQNHEKPIFNPINFVPNIDVIKNQHALNNKLQNNEALQQSLNLVPLMPNGNFFKPSFSAQSELITKPKLTSDLEKYAEEMFKESLKTIYNSQKWNNDRKVQSNNQSNFESNDIVALKNELMRLKAALPDTRQNKDILEAHHSENKIRTTEATKTSGNDQKKPDPLLTTLEELLKAQTSEPTHKHHGHRHNHHHSHKRPHSSNTKHLREFLTPPKPNSFHSTNHYHDKPKKRPGSAPPRFNHHSHSHGHSHGHSHNHNHFDGPRPHSKPSGLNSKTIGPEASASNSDVVRTSYPEFKKSHSFDDYTFTTSTPNLDEISKFIKEFRSPSNTEQNKQDINHPRIHNLLSLLMKNKQLPPGSSQSYFRNTDQLRQFFEDEKRRLQEQFYDDTLRSYLEKQPDNVQRFMPRSSITGADRIYANGAA